MITPAHKYKIKTETLLRCFVQANKSMQGMFAYDWLELLDKLDWCITTNDEVKLLSPFERCWITFKVGDRGQVWFQRVHNLERLMPAIVASSIVTDFLDDVDGIAREEDEDEDSGIQPQSIQVGQAVALGPGHKITALNPNMSNQGSCIGVAVSPIVAGKAWVQLP